jgi:serine protease Do
MRNLPLTLALAVSLAASVSHAEAPPAASNTKGWLGAYLGGSGGGSDEVGGQAPIGVQVGGIVEGSPAELAGLRASDWIVAIDGMNVASAAEAIAAVRRSGPGAWLSLSILRDGDPLDLQAKLEPAPPDTSRLTLARGWIGVSAIDLPPTLREHFGAPADRGVLISAVEPGSPAESAGLRLGDVVYELRGEPVRSAGDLTRQISGGGIGNEIEIVIARYGSEIHLDCIVSKAPSQE